jgi:hypothetical protein
MADGMEVEFDLKSLSDLCVAQGERIRVLEGTLETLLERTQTIYDGSDMLNNRIALLEKKALEGPVAGSKEPKVNDPESFTGDRTKLAEFFSRLTIKFNAESSKFSTDTLKIYYAASYLSGHPQQWFNNVLESTTHMEEEEKPEMLTKFVEFKKELSAIFGDPDAKKTAEKRLEALRQGEGEASVARYATEFRRWATFLTGSWGDGALRAKFIRGLKPQWQQAIAWEEGRTEDALPTLSDAIMFATRMDNRVAPEITSSTRTTTTSTFPP